MKNLTHRFKVHQQSTWFKLLLPTYLVLISLLLLTNDTFAQITQVGTATTANNSGTTITITNPAGIQVGDVLLANIVQDDNSGGTCLLYTSDAADDLLCVDLGGRRIMKKKTQKKKIICRFTY